MQCYHKRNNQIHSARGRLLSSLDPHNQTINRQSLPQKHIILHNLVSYTNYLEGTLYFQTPVLCWKSLKSWNLVWFYTYFLQAQAGKNREGCKLNLKTMLKLSELSEEAHVVVMAVRLFKTKISSF